MSNYFSYYICYKIYLEYCLLIHYICVAGNISIVSNSRLGVGPVSSKWWGDGGRKKGEDKQSDSVPPAGSWLYCFPESAANQQGRGSVFHPAVLTCRSLRPKWGRREGGLAREMAASAFHRASLRSRRGATCWRLSQLNSRIANGRNMATFTADIAGAVVAMTESDPGVASEKTSHNTLG
jgi:hypothetical protein